MQNLPVTLMNLVVPNSLPIGMKLQITVTLTVLRDVVGVHHSLTIANCLCTLSRRNVNSADAKEVVGMILESCASFQAIILQQKFDELSAKDPNESARSTYKYCASKYNDILYQKLTQAYVHLRLGRYADSTGDLNKALLFQNQCFNLLKNMKYPYYLRIYLKSFMAIFKMQKISSLNFINSHIEIICIEEAMLKRM